MGRTHDATIAIDLRPRGVGLSCGCWMGSILLALLAAGTASAAQFPVDDEAVAGRALADDDLLLSPRQDQRLLALAWQCCLTMQVSRQPLDQAVAELSQRSHLPIAIVPGCETSMHGGETWTLRQWPARERAQFNRFGDRARYAQLRMATISSSVRDRRLTASSSAALPLAFLLPRLFPNVAISYVHGVITIGNWPQLMPEVLIERSFLLRHPWGSQWRNTVNQTVYTVRLGLLDTYAVQLVMAEPAFLLEHEYEELEETTDPTGMYSRLAASKLPVEVRFDRGSSRLTLVGSPQAIDVLASYQLMLLDQPSPEEWRADAIACAHARLSAQDRSPPGVLSAERERQLRELWGRDATAAAAAHQALRQVGPPALPGILARARTIPGADVVGERLVEEITADREALRIRQVFEAYVRAVGTAEITTLARDFWSPTRRVREARAQADFEECLAQARQSPSLAERFRSCEPSQQGTPLDRMTYRAAWRARLPEDPRFEGVRITGHIATVALSWSLPQGKQGSSDLQPVRLPGTLGMIEREGRWLVDSPRTVDDPRPVVWMRPDGELPEVVADGVIRWRPAAAGAAKAMAPPTTAAGVWDLAFANNL